MNGPTDEILATIASTDSGIALIYRSLDALVAQFDLQDAAVVLEERQIGRQIFCAGRRPLGASDDELLVAPPGLYTQADKAIEARVTCHPPRVPNCSAAVPPEAGPAPRSRCR